jgi:hypothetical protein
VTGRVPGVRRGPALAGVPIVLLAVACGGGTATAPDTGNGSSLTVASTPVGGTGAVATIPAFPATTAAGVIQLATLRPNGVATYHVTVTSGSGELAYDLEVASTGERARLHQTQASGEVWVGMNVRTRAITYMCTAAAGQSPSCKAGDPDGVGTTTAQAIARLLGNDVIEATFGAVAAAPGTTVATDTQLGTPVSCMAAASPAGDLRLCATADGQITELTAAGTKAVATSISADVSAADVDAPVG